MPLILAIGAGLIVLSVGLLFMAIFGTGKDPNENKDSKVKQMYPVNDDPEYSTTEENFPSWKHAQNN